MQCMNICQDYKVKKPELGVSRYEAGQKFCSHCEVFMKIDGNRCPCCKYLLKIGSSKRRRENTIRRI